MSDYPRHSTLLRVRPSEIQPGDILLGPPPANLPSDLRLVRLPRGQEWEQDSPSLPPLGRERLPKPGLARRASSLDRDFRAPSDSRGTVTRRRRRRRHHRPPQDDDQYDSEGSIPPRSRRPTSGKQREKRRSNRDRDGDGDGDGSSSESSSDLGCTDDDEKMKRKAKWKKWGAIGLAGVATIHAVHGAHETFEKTQARRKELAEGTITGEEARKRRNQGRWKTAADVGIAAVWVKSAYDEIQEYREVHKEYAEVVEKSEERHRKRLERARQMRNEQYRGHHALDDADNYRTD